MFRPADFMFSVLILNVKFLQIVLKNTVALYPFLTSKATRSYFWVSNIKNHFLLKKYVGILKPWRNT